MEFEEESVTSWFLRARKLRPGSLDAESSLDRLVAEDAEGDPAAPRLASAFAFILRLGRALLSQGLPAQRLEESLRRAGEALGLTVDCFSTPTALIVTASDGEHTRTRVARVEPGDTDLERLSALHALVRRVERRELSASEGASRIDRILARPPRYRGATAVIGAGLASAGSAILLGGSATDVLPALSLGTLVGLMGRGASRVPTLARILPALAALVASLLAHAIGLAGVPVHESVLVLSAVLVLLPGFTLTVATLELATGNLVSGTSRLVGGLSTLVQLGFGVALGHRIAQLLPELADAAPAAAAPEWLMIVAHGVVALAFTVVLRAAPRDVPAILFGAAVTVLGARLGRAWLGPELGAFLGATAIALVAHAHARLKDRPSLLLLTPGMLMLVPGSVGFLSVSSMLEADVVTALQTGFRMILIATALAAGVLVASVAIPPRRPL